MTSQNQNLRYSMFGLLCRFLMSIVYTSCVNGMGEGGNLHMKGKEHPLEEMTYPGRNQYLMIDHGGVLDGEIVLNKEEITPQDLTISKIPGVGYQVLKNGVRIVKTLNQLIKKHHFGLVFHSKCKEQDQVDLLYKLREQCQAKGISFPKVSAIAVKDAEVFAGVSSDRPTVIRNRNHGIPIVGYSKELDGKSCLRQALSEFLDISPKARKHHYVLDDGPSVVNKARLEGWKTYRIGQVSLEQAIDEIYQQARNQPLPILEKPNPSCSLKLVDNKQFTLLEGPEELGGSSRSRMKVTYGNKEWFCKSSAELEDALNVNTDIKEICEYKEFISLKLYELFGVRVPKLALTIRRPEFSKDDQGALNQYTNYKKPRLHILSQYVEGFHDLGKDFYKDYRAHTQSKSPYYYHIDGKPLKGFGTALAVATLLYDYDCVGNSGGNMGYVSHKDYVQLVKIDAGECLPFKKNISEGNKHDPGTRDMLLGTGGTRLSYDELNPCDQHEFVRTVHQILTCSDDTLESFFKDLIAKDKRFKESLETLKERKNKFLNAFTPEVREKIEKALQVLKKEQAEQEQADWNKPLDEQKIENINKQKLLGAQLALHNLNNQKKGWFQVPPAVEDFVGRDQELTKTHKALQQAPRLHCLVGSGGMGKTSLATAYVHKHAKDYQQVFWFHAENDLFYQEVHNYLTTKCKEDLKDKSLQEVMRLFYQKMSKSKTLLVLDNAENEKSLKAYLPKKQHNNLSILITSRNQQWSYSRDLLEPFHKQSVKEYIEKRLEMAVSPGDIQQLEDLLGGLPLAVAQAASYMKQQKEKVSPSQYKYIPSQYIALFKQETALMLKQGEDQSAVATILTMALKAVRDLAPKAVEEILSIAPYLAPDHITVEQILSYCKDYKANQALRHLMDYSIVPNLGEEPRTCSASFQHIV